MNIPMTILLFGAAIFIVLAVIGIIRGFKTKERVYKINSLVCILLSVWLVLLFFNQFILSIGFFVAGAILSLANLSKSIKTASKEAVASRNQVDKSKPLSVSDLFSWGGWFKIAYRWGVRKAMLLYILFNLCFIWLLPIALLIFNIGSPFLVAFIAITVTIGVIISSIPIFNQQVVKNLETEKR